MSLEIQAKQLTEEWFALVLQVANDDNATEREKQLATCLRDCGRVLNDLVLAIHNAKVVPGD